MNDVDMGLKKLCLDLVKAENEDEVVSILRSKNFWDNDSNWRCLGDKENNFRDVGNQKDKPEDALTEKIVNSIDAVLMRDCLVSGTNPEGDDAPAGIFEAVEEFFEVRDGNLYNLTSRERAELAENICVVATGKKSNPCYSIIDRGEGQTPNRLPKTILSLDESNKLRIPFVQGKFNMGGTGVLQFCGRHNLQLVLSKRHPKIAKVEDDETKQHWGFTVIRREKPKEGMKNSVYKYLVVDDEVPKFKSETLPLLPGKYPEPYEKEMVWGTFIKLYEFQIGRSLKTNIQLDLYYKLNVLLPEIALPVRLYERRKGYSGHTQETTLAGLSVRLQEDRSSKIEDNFPVSSVINILGQRLRTSIYVFKDGEEKYRGRGSEGIIFTVNGQTHGTLPKDFFKRNRVGMSYLADSLLVLVNCDELDTRYREDFFYE
jgi:hypothetical protein